MSHAVYETKNIHRIIIEHERNKKPSSNHLNRSRSENSPSKPPSCRRRHRHKKDVRHSTKAVDQSLHHPVVVIVTTRTFLLTALKQLIPSSSSVSIARLVEFQHPPTPLQHRVYVTARKYSTVAKALPQVERVRNTTRRYRCAHHGRAGA